MTSNTPGTFTGNWEIEIHLAKIERQNILDETHDLEIKLMLATSHLSPSNGIQRWKCWRETFAATHTLRGINGPADIDNATDTWTFKTIKAYKDFLETLMPPVRGAIIADDLGIGS